MYFSNIGIVGCGGREHSIGKKLKKDNEEVKLFYIGSHNIIGLDLARAKLIKKEPKIFTEMVP